MKGGFLRVLAGRMNSAPASPSAPSSMPSAEIAGAVESLRSAAIQLQTLAATLHVVADALSQDGA